MSQMIFPIFTIAFFIAIGWFFTWAARLHWINSSRAPRMIAFRTNSEAVRRGHERGLVPFAAWAWMLGLGLLLLLPALTGPTLAPVGAALVIGSFLPLMLHATIAWFNWPKLLAPPHRRNEAGSIVDWFRSR